MTPATRLYLMGFDTAFILAKYMPEDPDAFTAEVEEEARIFRIDEAERDFMASVKSDEDGFVQFTACTDDEFDPRKAIEGAKR